uniref:Uncharacterized protein n=1 Tax=Parascaris univalens TaxID=6257 RepID=A0A914ZFB3_PARUN
HSILTPNLPNNKIERHRKASNQTEQILISPAEN